MPQLVPFYFINEVVFAFSVIVIVHYYYQNTFYQE